MLLQTVLIASLASLSFAQPTKDKIKPDLNLIRGTYELVEKDNERFETFLAEIGVNYLLRILARIAKPVQIEVEFDEASEEFTIRTTSPFRSYENKFKLDEEYERTLYGWRCVSKVTLIASDTLYQKQKCKLDGNDLPELSQTRKFFEDKFVNTFKTPKTTATRTYERVEGPRDFNE